MAAATAVLPVPGPPVMIAKELDRPTTTARCCSAVSGTPPPGRAISSARARSAASGLRSSLRRVLRAAATRHSSHSERSV